MKIGLISDIHANLPALETALALLDAEKVDQILCAGDLVEKGEQGNEVVQLIRDRNIPCVKGNHDAMAPINQRWIRNNMELDDPRVQKKLLSQESLDFLKTLPLQLRFEWEGYRILLVHGTPDSNREYLWEKSPRNKIFDQADRADADIIVYGHTHALTYFSTGKVKFINPGSVTKHDRRSSSTCAVLTLPICHVEGFSLETGVKSAQRARIIR